MQRWKVMFQSFGRDERGTTAIEYSMLCMLIVIGIIALNEQIGASVAAFFAAAAAGFS
jgi:Flp pilus assembly pilin Flp